MSKTRADLIHRALRNLGCLPMGEAPSAEEYQSMSDLVDAMVAELSQRNIIYIAHINLIDDAHFIPLGNILAWKAAPEFGSASDPALAALAVDGEQKLKEMDRQDILHIHKRTMRSDYPIQRTIALSTTCT